MSFGSLDSLWIVGPIFLLWAGSLVALKWFETRGRVRLGGAVGYASVGALASLPPPRGATVRRVLELSRIAALGLLAMAWLRPQASQGALPSSTEGIDIVLAVDTSGSMRALDLDSDKPIPMRRNRLEVVRDVVDAFIPKRPNDALGLVVFGAEAFMQCPLTLDHDMLANVLGKLEVGMAGDATALGDGLGAAVKRLQKSKAKSKVVVLLTDGVNNAGVLSPQKAAEVAKSFGVKVYTIGAGTRGRAPFITPGAFARVVYDDVQIDEAALRDIATTTSGEYFRAEDVSSLAAIYDRIDKLEKSKIESPTVIEYEERFPMFVWPALLLLMAEIVLLGGRFARVP